MHFHGFRLEGSAIVGVVILILRMQDKLSDLPKWAKFVHFAIVAVYSVIGVAGSRILLVFCLRHDLFVRVLSRPNSFGIDAPVMQWLAMTFAVGGIAMFIAVMLLGSFNARAGRVFSYVVLPCSLLYPLVMVSALGYIDPSPLAARVIIDVTVVLLVIAGASIGFYNSRTLTRVTGLDKHLVAGA
jgi:hypothetical protein